MQYTDYGFEVDASGSMMPQFGVPWALARRQRTYAQSARLADRGGLRFSKSPATRKPSTGRSDAIGVRSKRSEVGDDPEIYGVIGAFLKQGLLATRRGGFSMNGYVMERMIVESGKGCG